MFKHFALILLLVFTLFAAPLVAQPPNEKDQKKDQRKELCQKLLSKTSSFMSQALHYNDRVNRIKRQNEKRKTLLLKIARATDENRPIDLDETSIPTPYRLGYAILEELFYSSFDDKLNQAQKNEIKKDVVDFVTENYEAFPPPLQQEISQLLYEFELYGYI